MKKQNLRKNLRKGYHLVMGFVLLLGVVWNAADLDHLHKLPTANKLTFLLDFRVSNGIKV